MKGLYDPKEMTLIRVGQINYAVKGNVENGTEERLEKNHNENGTLDAAQIISGSVQDDGK